MEDKKETLDLGFAKLDLQREARCGFPEVVYCAGKTVGQSVQILDVLMDKYDNVIGTRADKAVYDALISRHPAAQYDPLARMVYQHKDKTVVNGDRLISVITAGTSDIPIAEEAALTAEIMGNRVERIYDVGVAGIHRLLARVDDIRQANVNIVVAGMEGAEEAMAALPVPMYILTNRDGRYGVAGILDKKLLRGLADREGMNLYLLPSSVHEFILLLDDGQQDAEALGQMVAEINQIQVLPEERLEDHAYYYDRKADEIWIAE